ncbi:MAG: bifunctional UDP-N-acetylmuramoyl-tripeptide:D-alanyl-D-alanine ligase/alanine racemase [Bacteroidales bacterium]
MRYSTKSVQHICRAKLHGPGDIICEHILTDSRSLINPGTCLFFAIPGLQYDGHDFIDDLYKAGVRAFVTEKLPSLLHKDAAYLHCNEVVECLQQLMAHHRSNFVIPVAAITGSNGKTIVKEWFAQILSKDRKVCRSPKSYNSQIGVPLSLALLDESDQTAVFEAGISRPDEMEKLEKIIRPDIALLTNLGEAHQENFESSENKLREKLRLFSNCTTAILPFDDPKIPEVWKSLYPAFQGKLISWAFHNPEAEFQVACDTGKSSSKIHIVSEKLSLSFDIPFIDRASGENAVSTALLLHACGLDKKFIEQNMPGLQPVAMRLELKHGIHNCTIINDSYNADINALRIAIDFAERQNKQGIVLILSDILESGTDKNALYKEIAGLINTNERIDMFVGVGRDLKDSAAYFSDDARFFPSTQAFLDSGLWHSFRNQSILLKGARPFRFENISSVLELKAHQTLLEIKLEAVTHNLRYFRSRLNPGVKMMVMVKAFSYGSGSVEIGRHLQNQAVDYLGVAIADEGVELRKAGVHIPIIVMNPQPGSFDLLFEYKLEPEVYSLAVLQSLTAHIHRQGIPYLGIHLKLDTGMHRLGIGEDELSACLEHLKNTGSLHVKSVFSHLAGSDVPSLDDFTEKQIACFHRMYAKLQDSLGASPLRHIANTNGIIRFPGAQLDMVRLGIGLYGISAEENEHLEKTTVFRTKIISIKHLKKGESVGYNRAGIIRRASDIALIPVGYADGLNRQLGNGKWKVEINNRLYPTIGDVCMDMCMLDITGSDIREGDDAIIFGGMQQVEDMAEQLETIPYEILTGISQRVKRVYLL